MLDEAIFLREHMQRSNTTVTSLIRASLIRTSLIAQLVKNLPAMQETPVPFLGWEDPLEKG